MDLHPRPDRIASLRGPAESASAKVASAFFTTSTVCAYVFLVSAATTHEQLIKQASAHLPIINVAVPLFWFAAFAPTVCGLLAIVGLLQAATLSRRNALLDLELRAIPLRSEREFQRSTVNALPMGVTTETSNGRMTSLAWSSVTCCVLALMPLLLLLYVQATFLPYHSLSLTWFHRILVFACAAAIVVLLPSTIFPSVERKGGFGRTAAGVGIAATIALPAIAASLFVLTVPDEGMERLVLRLAPDALIDEVPLSPKTLHMSGTREGVPTPRPRRMLAWTYALLEAPRTPFDLSRNLRLDESADLVVSRPSESQLEKLGEWRAWQEYGRGLNLSGRDLRYAELSKVDLRKADLRAATLRGANLAGAKLDFVNARPWDQGDCGRRSRDCPTTFVFASLSEASVRYADLLGADLEYIDGSSANFEKANLFLAKLTLSDLRRSRFAGTDLNYAVLTGSDARDAKFILAKIGNLKAEAVDFSRATFVALLDTYGVRFAGSTMHGARMIDTYFDPVAVDASGIALTHSSLFGWERNHFSGARCRTPSQDEERDILSNVRDASLQLDISKAFAKVMAQPCSPTGHDVWLKSDEPAPSVEQMTVALLRLACRNGEGNHAIALGLMRRIHLMRQRAERDKEIFPDNRDTEESAEAKPWIQLERSLADPKICGSAAAAVSRRIAGNW